MAQQDPIQAPPIPKPPVEHPAVIQQILESPFLKAARFPGPPAIVEFRTTGDFNFTRFEVSRPTLLRFLATDAPVNTDYASPAFWPSVSPTDVGINPIVPNLVANFSKGMDMFLWAPGVWYISMDTTSAIAAGARFQYLSIACEDPTVVQHFLDRMNQPNGPPTVGVDIVTGAAANLATLREVLASHRIEIQNTNAAAVNLRIAFGSTVPTATTGILIAAGATYTLEPWTVPTARIRVFSAAAGTVNIRRFLRGTV